MDLPHELAELDAELASIAYEERPSFSPELRGELVRRWTTGDLAERRLGRTPRSLMAAGVASLLMVGVGVPAARASLIHLVHSLQAPGSSSTEPAVPGPVRAPVPLAVAPMIEGRSGVEAAGEARPLPTEPRARARMDITFPELSDRSAVERRILESYPRSLQEAGVGGTVRLMLWVDSLGQVDASRVDAASGVPELDRLALDLSRSFAFEPARRDGHGVGTWVEFDVVFQVPSEDADRYLIPTVAPVEEPTYEAPLASAGPTWSPGVVLPAPEQREAGDLLSAALAEDLETGRLGPVQAVLNGEPPSGVAPIQWRRDAGEALERAMARDPDNPVPLLALARIRRKQGLKTEARVLFERGLQRAIRAGAGISPGVVAELYFERGRLIQESWLASRNLGRVAAEALPSGACSQARSSGGATSGYASIDRLIAWNYMCPSTLGTILERSFESRREEHERALAILTGSFRSAVTAYPGHVGSNVQILLAEIDEGAWAEAADGARRFVWASRGHPHALLISGMALQRLGRSEEAEGQFRLALRSLTPADRRAMLDVAALLDPDGLAQYTALSGEARDAWSHAFWEDQDPILSTEVNEREVEHLARAAYAILRFDGVDTDPARVWIRYGRPDHVRSFADGSDVRTEFWDYGPGPDITFRRLSSSLRMDLTPEARAYVAELRSVLPHIYGDDGRIVTALEGQVVRYRGATRGFSDLEIDVTVPGALRRADGDSLDLGVFLLGDAGKASSTVRRRVASSDGSVRVSVPAPAAAAGVVVELHDPATGATAVLRRTDGLRVAEEDDPMMSDLLLTSAARPTPRSVERRAWWIAPASEVVSANADRTGVFFEIYDLAAAPWYRLRAEYEDPATGRVRALEIRPAGEDDFGASWDRLPRSSGPTPEFLNVSWRDVPPGEYTLRVVADLPGTETPVRAERRILRR